MAAGSAKQILDAGIALIKALPDRPPTAWPHVKPDDPFPPENSDLWWKVAWFPNKGDDSFWDNEAPVRAYGFFQILVCAKQDKGVLAEDEADRIIAAVSKGTALGPVRISRQPYMSPAIDEDDKVFVPVTLPYDGFVQ